MYFLSAYRRLLYLMYSINCLQLTKSVHTVSVAAAVTLDKLSSIRLNQFSRYIPTLTSAVGTGVSLVAHGETAGEEEKARLHRLLFQLLVSYVK
ncbi:hypothetical protein ACEQPO_10215 [Bacillus sp. SL00103]